MMKNLSLILFALCLCDALHAQRNINFNADWSFNPPASTQITTSHEHITLPRAWNEEYAFRVPIASLPDDTVRYCKTFTAPRRTKEHSRIFIEFEGARQGAEVWLNGQRIGLHENGVMAFGFDLTPYIKWGKQNRIEVLTDNDWGYKEKNTPEGSTYAAPSKDSNDLPNNVLQPKGFQWNNKNFNANYGGLPKNVRLHIVGDVYQTLPLYSNLGTTGTYIYASDIDVQARQALIHAESQVRNEGKRDLQVRLEVQVIDPEGNTVSLYHSNITTIARGETLILKAENLVKGLHFWSWGYGYLYDVVTRVQDAKKNRTIDEVTTRTGFRKTEFANGQFKLNDRTIMMHGYAQRTSNEWPGVGMSVPAWLSDYSNNLQVESGGNLVRWMHVCPWKQDIESCDRVGLIQAMPAGDAEKDVTGRHWEQRTELMRDAIIYNRNNPSIIFYECGNKGISEQHMREMKAIRDMYDPHGGRAIGSREMLNRNTAAEYGGEMLYINKSGNKPVWAMEYDRDEGLRRYWDDWSWPYHKSGDGPLYRNAPAREYNHNSDQLAISMIRTWYDYWMVRPGTGTRVSSGGAKIIFSDTNTHCRGESNYRTSGVTDPMRIPKDAFYAHQVMWNGWVTPEESMTYIMGHWNYEPGTVKPVYVVSDAPQVKLYLNGKEIGNERISYHFLHTFDQVEWHPGTLKAVSCDAQGNELSSYTLETVGEPVRLVMHKVGEQFHHQLAADGADMELIEVEAVDAQDRRCPLAHQMLQFSIDGPIEWIGGIGKGEGNCVRSLTLPLECGVNRVLVRSTGKEGLAHVNVSAEGLTSATIELDARNRESNYIPYYSHGETPATPSYQDIKKTIKVASVTAGCNQETAVYGVDDSEDTEWKNDGRASTAWYTMHLAAPARVDEISIKFTGWRRRSYPIEIYADDKLIWSGKTKQSLGYVHLPISFAPVASSITIRLQGTATEKEAFGAITELAAPVANELDLYKAENGDKVNSELRIVECDLLQYVK